MGATLSPRDFNNENGMLPMLMSTSSAPTMKWKGHWIESPKASTCGVGLFQVIGSVGPTHRQNRYTGGILTK